MASEGVYQFSHGQVVVWVIEVVSLGDWMAVTVLALTIGHDNLATEVVEYVSARGVPGWSGSESLHACSCWGRVSVRGMTNQCDHKLERPPGQEIISKTTSNKHANPHRQVKGRVNIRVIVMV